MLISEVIPCPSLMYYALFLPKRTVEDACPYSRNIGAPTESVGVGALDNPHKENPKRK